NSIFIRHYEADLERIKKLIREKLDIPLPQVKIEARLNELNRTDFFALGVSWGGAAVRRLTTGGDVLVGQGVSGQRNTAATIPPIIAPTGGIPPVFFGEPGNNPNLTLANVLPVSATTGLPLGGNIVNFPILPGTFGTPASIAFGLISRKLNINLVLDALEAENKTTSLSKPEVVVKEGETLAIGGIRQRDVSESVSKVPFFGDIPVLGLLFRSKSRTTDPNRELVVFITPYVLKLDVVQAPPAEQPKK